jgi:LysM repeat protein
MYEKKTHRKLLIFAITFLVAGLVLLWLYKHSVNKPASPTKPPAAVQSTPSVPPATKQHKVQKGDALQKISKRYCGEGSQYRSIARDNKITNPNLIWVGQVLSISCKDLPVAKRVSVARKRVVPKTQEVQPPSPSQQNTPAPKLIIAMETKLSKEFLLSMIEASKEKETAEFPPLSSVPTMLQQAAQQEGPSQEQPEMVSANQEPEQDPPPQVAENPKKRGRIAMKNGIKNVMLSPYRAVKSVFTNPRRAISTGLMALSIGAPEIGIPATIGVSAAMSFAAPRSAKAQGLTQQSSVSVPVNASMPTRAEVEQAGRTPNLRYTVPSGELNLVSSSLFSQPPYKGNKAAIEGLPRDLASNLSLTGFHAYNDFGGFAAEVILSEKAVIIYQRTSEGIIPLYLADCRCGGKPCANRIQLIQPPPKKAETSGVQQAQAGASQVTNNFNAPASPPFPGAITLNLVGLPQQPAAPTETTQRIIVERDRWQKYESFGKGTFYLLAGPAAIMAGRGIMGLPGAMQNSARIKADSNVKVANINAQGLVDAAKNRVPDTTTVTASSESNPVIGPINNTNSTEVGVAVDQNQNQITEVKNDNKIDAEINNTVPITVDNHVGGSKPPDQGGHNRPPNNRPPDNKPPDHGNHGGGGKPVCNFQQQWKAAMQNVFHN